MIGGAQTFQKHIKLRPLMVMRPWAIGHHGVAHWACDTLSTVCVGRGWMDTLDN